MSISTTTLTTAQNTLITNLETKETNVHLSKYLELFKSDSKFKKREACLSNKKWVACVQLFFSAGPSLRSQLTSSLLNDPFNDLFLSEGTCAGFVIDHLSRFFQNGSPLGSSPLSIGSPSHSEGISFASFKVDKESLEKQTSRARFLQAAYKLSSTHAKVLEKKGIVTQSEDFPKSILAKNKLKLDRQYPTPDPKLNLFSYKIEHLLPKLKKLADQNDKKGYLFALGGSEHHAIALHLNAPYHFFDPFHGIAQADSLENLVLLLAGFIAVHYSCSHTFTLLEFSPAQTSSIT